MGNVLFLNRGIEIMGEFSLHLFSNPSKCTLSCPSHGITVVLNLKFCHLSLSSYTINPPAPAYFVLSFTFYPLDFHYNFFIVKEKKGSRPIPIKIRGWWLKIVLFWTGLHKTWLFKSDLSICVFSLVVIVVIVVFLGMLLSIPWE